MSLSQYQQKRNFEKTSEPRGKEQHSKGSLCFVVQKHDASQVHYDFRLEMDGVLKSWAVPKGPSLNPADKRLALEVEDHPYHYRSFEGVIPEGAYGAGTVMVWDEGTYEPTGAPGLRHSEQEKELLRQWEAGKMTIVLHGQKLRGAYSLFKVKNRNQNAWMLVKKKDQWSSTHDVTQENASVKSGKTLAEVAGQHGAVLHHPEAEKPASNSAAPKQPKATVKSNSRAKNSTRSSHPSGSITAGDILAAMPQKVAPMLATLTDAPFNDANWLFEIKWDGYRALAYCNGKSVELLSRNQKSFTPKYAPIARALEQLNLHAVLDGEIVAVDENGLANFQLLQNWQNTPARLQYFVFDMIWADGQDLTQLPLIGRKELLQQKLPAHHDLIRFSDHVIERGKDFFQAAAEQGLEGVMAKRRDSIYQFGSRTPDWLKIKVSLRQEVVIAGYTAPQRSRKFFGSLLLGVYEAGKLVYVGHTGSGFNTQTLEQLYHRMQPLIMTESPFAQKPKTNRSPTWIKPQLVCEIKFTEWTAGHQARHAIFMGLRPDKKAKEVILEKSTPVATLKRTKKAAAEKNPATKKETLAVSGATSLVNDLEAGAEESTIKANGIAVPLTNLQKTYWPKEGFRKGDVLHYYQQMAPFIMPYLLDRPQSLNRHPNGIAGPHFFQKDVKGKVPDWIETFSEYSESTGENVEYLVCSNEATLLYMANLGCIEINPWHARKQHYRKPDWCLIDLDPDENNSFNEVVEVALMVKQVLDSIGADGCVKTSGSTGMHIYVPLGARYDFDQSKALAEGVVMLVHQELPELTSMERSPAKRRGKIYLDFLQNKETQTAAAPYSLRPKPGVPVSTPLHWSEVKKGLTPQTWNAYNIAERVQAEGDLFEPVLGKGIDLPAVLQILQSILA